jgi:MFS family permease
MATPGVSESTMLRTAARSDFWLMLASRVSSRFGDGFLRILSVLLVAAKSKDPMIAGLVLVFRYVCEILINAISGPFIDKMRIKTSLVTSDLLRTAISLTLVGAVLLGNSYQTFLVLSFLGDFVFIFFKPAADKVVKVSFAKKEGTKVLSQLDAANHFANIAGYMVASGLAGLIKLETAVLFGPVFFFISFLLVSRLRLLGEEAIDYGQDKKKSYWERQREGLRYTWASPPLRLLLLGRSIVAVARGSFSVLSVVYLAAMAKGLSAYGYFESAQSAGKLVVTALVIPIFFAYRSTFLLTGLSLLAIALSFFGLNMVDSVALACVVGVLVGAGQAAEAVGIDAIINRFADARVQGRAKSTTSFGSRLTGLVAIAFVYFAVNVMHVEARSLFGYLGVFPLFGAMVYFLGWMLERGTLARMEFEDAPDVVATLTVTSGGSSGQVITVGDKPVVLGRSHRSDAVLDDESVSRFHATVRREHGQYVVEDMRSRNGVLIDGQKVPKGSLMPGSQLQLGAVSLVFEVEEKKPEKSHKKVEKG